MNIRLCPMSLVGSGKHPPTLVTMLNIFMGKVTKLLADFTVQ